MLQDYNNHQQETHNLEEDERPYGFEDFMPKPEDYFSEYNKNIQDNLNNDDLKFQKLTWQFFGNEAGREWLNIMKEHLYNQFVDLNNPKAELFLCQVQGSRALIRNVEYLLSAHEAHIKGS